MSLKLEFVERASAPGAKLAPLCREFGISRPTGHKWLKRFEEQGFDGLEEQSRRPLGTPLALAEEMVMSVLETRDQHPAWGAKKIVAFLRKRFGEGTPSVASVARMLRRSGRVRQRRFKRHLSVVETAPSVTVNECNDLWTVDFKGWWRARDGERCEPLTVRDAFSRYVLIVKLTATTIEAVQAIFEGLFRKHGLPKAIQTDNGEPFVCSHARAGLTRLSAWWVSLGISHIRGRRGCPQDNGGHERMHLDIAIDVERFPSATTKEQQRVLEKWRQEFNHVRPHEALKGRVPADIYRSSPRCFRVASPAMYPRAELIRRVSKSGCIRIDNEKYFIGIAFRDHVVGLEPLRGGAHFRVRFYGVDCGELEIAPVEVVERLVTKVIEARRSKRSSSSKKGLSRGLKAA